MHWVTAAIEKKSYEENLTLTFVLYNLGYLWCNVDLFQFDPGDPEVCQTAGWVA